MNLLPSALVYAGLVSAFVSIISVIKPIPIRPLRTRRRSLLTLLASFCALIAGFMFPASETRVEAAQARLDEFVPVYQFNEFHTVRVRASREQVYAAIRAVTPSEIRLFKTLTWIGRRGRATPPSIMNAPDGIPIIDTATHTGFLLLSEDPGKEIVFGFAMSRKMSAKSPEQFRAFQSQNGARVAMNFRVEPSGDKECTVTTETRIYTTGEPAHRVFRAYWRVIYPGSSLIRRMWLRAIRLRAESMAQ